MSRNTLGVVLVALGLGLTGCGLEEPDAESVGAPAAPSTTTQAGTDDAPAEAEEEASEEETPAAEPAPAPGLDRAREEADRLGQPALEDPTETPSAFDIEE